MIEPLPPEIRALIADSEDAQWRFEKEHAGTWSPSVTSDYEAVFAVLSALPRREGLFLEWGSGFGVITLMAAWLGFDAHGIELNPDLVEMAEELAERHSLSAAFAAGTFLEDGAGEDGYAVLREELASFDVVFAYPWPGEEELFLDLFRRGARPGATLVFNRASGGIEIHTAEGRG